jgi:5'-deoxynucleotidase YfbR-like HD superfamily hydrolase
MAEASDGCYDRLYIPRDGVWFDPRDPEPEKMSVETIAHGLATEFRYGGHTDPLVNVAQHSVDTARLLEEHGYGPEIQFYGLHHDSAEAYLGDSQKPNKEVISGIDELEDIWQEAVWDFLEVGSPTPKQESTVKDADYMLYTFEADRLFENGEHSREATSRVDLEERDQQEELATLEDIVDLDQAYMESKESFLETHRDLVTRI